MSKTKYKIQNWSEYDAALVNRGSITVWFAEDYVTENLSVKPSGKRGAPLITLFKQSHSNVVNVESRVQVTVSFVGRFFTLDYGADEFGFSYS